MLLTHPQSWAVLQRYMWELSAYRWLQCDRNVCGYLPREAAQREPTELSTGGGTEGMLSGGQAEKD